MTESETPETQSKPAEAATAAAEAQTSAPDATPASGASLEEQLAAAKKEAVENYNRYLRAVADLENARKRAVREKDELRQYSAGRVLEDLLPVLDNLALGIAASKQPNAEVKSIADGVEMVVSQLKNALAGHGLKEINPVGQAFDPHQHEAISHIPSAEVPAEQVIMIIRTGYSHNGRLLRPASVVVSSGPAPVESH
ncbi:MAG: nucleotide exchange factor GrpE [Opitutaceae bacterium]